MDFLISLIQKLSELPLGWTVAVVCLGYIVVVLKRSDDIQEARLNDFKEVLSKYEELAHQVIKALKTGGK